MSRWAETAQDRADASGVTRVASMQSPAGLRSGERARAPHAVEASERSESAPQAAQPVSTTAMGPAANSQQTYPAAPAWLHNTPRAMLVVALISLGVLLALLYFGGFLG